MRMEVATLMTTNHKPPQHNTNTITWRGWLCLGAVIAFVVIAISMSLGEYGDTVVFFMPFVLLLIIVLAILSALRAGFRRTRWHGVAAVLFFMALPFWPEGIVPWTVAGCLYILLLTPVQKRIQQMNKTNKKGKVWYPILPGEKVPEHVAQTDKENQEYTLPARTGFDWTSWAIIAVFAVVPVWSVHTNTNMADVFFRVASWYLAGFLYLNKEPEPKPNWLHWMIVLFFVALPIWSSHAEEDLSLLVPAVLLLGFSVLVAFSILGLLIGLINRL